MLRPQACACLTGRSDPHHHEAEISEAFTLSPYTRDMANISLTAFAALGCGLALVTLQPAPAAAQCQLCAGEAQAAAAKKNPRPITIEIETSIDFAKLGLASTTQGGTALIDPATGQRTITGALLDLGGVPVTGTVTIRGEPKEHVAVNFPATVLIYNSGGASYPITGFTTTLKNNPKIGDDGTLRFTFGATLQVSGGAAGKFRGSVPITVEYR